MSLKLTGELCVMTMKNDAKFEIELACHFKIDRRNVTNFESQNLHFNGLILTKVYIVSAKKVQISYIWWHSRWIQSLKEK